MRIFRTLTLFITILQALAISSCTSEKPVPRKTDHLANFGLKGYVRTLTETGYDAAERPDGIVKGALRFSLVYKFNESGNTSESQIFDSTGRMYSRMVFSYNEAAQLTELDDYGYGKLRSRKVYSYDVSGNETECKTFLPDNRPVERIVKRYDQKGHKTEEIQEIPDSGVVSRYVSEYDSTGLLIETIGYQPDSAVIDITDFTYDMKGKLISAITRDDDSTLVITESYMYDEEGKIIGESSSFAGFSRITTYYYSMYDKSGNWLRRVEKTTILHGPSEMLLRERKIEYYPE